MSTNESNPKPNNDNSQTTQLLHRYLAAARSGDTFQHIVNHPGYHPLFEKHANKTTQALVKMMQQMQTPTPQPTPKNR